MRNISRSDLLDSLIDTARLQDPDYELQLDFSEVAEANINNIVKAEAIEQYLRGTFEIRWAECLLEKAHDALIQMCDYADELKKIGDVANEQANEQANEDS